MSALAQLALIGLGGAIGAILRHLLSGAILSSSRAPDAAGAFPTGTLIVNILGCLALGVVAGFFLEGERIKDPWRLALTVGLLGGFTTLSTSAFAAMYLWRTGHAGRALLYLALSNAGGLLAIFLGFAAARSVS